MTPDRRPKLYDRVAAIAPFNDDGLLLFGLRGDGKGWCLPGGHFEEGDDPIAAAHRELLEETGLIAIELEYLGSSLGNSPGISVWCFKTLVAGEPDASADPDGEFVEFRWVDPKNIPVEIRDNLRDRPNCVLDFLGIPYGHTVNSTFRKAQPGPVFPKLGLTDRRRHPVALVNTPRQLQIQDKAMTEKILHVQQASPTSVEGPLTMQGPTNYGEKANRQWTDIKESPLVRDFARSRLSSPAPDTMPVGASNLFGHPQAYSMSSDLREELKPDGMAGPKSQGATELHEGLHNLFRQVGEKYGTQGRFNLSRNLYRKLQLHNPSGFTALREYIRDRYPRMYGSVESPRDTNYNIAPEEHFTTLLNYLNNPEEREKYHTFNGHDAAKRRAFGNNLKSAHRTLMQLGRDASKLDLLAPAHRKAAEWAEVERGMAKSLAPAPFDPHQEALVGRIQDSLSDDLRRDPWKGSSNCLSGHCYAASEALWHLLGGPESGYTPQQVHHEGSSHWYLRHNESGHIIDPTADQFQEKVPYDQGKGKGFLTAQPSHRARIIMERAMNPLMKAEAAQHWRSKDGLRIPIAGTPERRTWNQKFVQGIAHAFAGGEHTRLKPMTLDIEQPGLSTNMAVNKPRLQLYRRMLAAGEKLPPVVVQRSGTGWRLLDGNHRVEAAKALGHKQLPAVEVTAPVKRT